MKEFVSHSQAGQDKFIHDLLGDSGTFLDIGACHPVELSNTYALEQLGWTGICADNDPGACKLLREQRTAKVIEGDATKVDWMKYLTSGVIDYLSADIDQATLLFLRNFPLDKVRFRAITIEHDLYRNPPEVKREIYSILTRHGYIRVCEDVRSQDLPFEDWFVAPELVEKAKGIL